MLLKKKIKTIEDQDKKHVDDLNTLKLTIEDVIPKNALNNNEAKKELDKIKEIEKKETEKNLFTKQMSINIVLKIFKQ